MIPLVIVTICLAVTCCVLGIKLVASKDADSRLSRKKTYTVRDGDKAVTLRLTHREYIGVKSVINLMAYEYEDSSLKIDETKIL